MQNLGLVAGVLTTAAWLPQIARTWRSRSADDLSWPYLLVFSSGVALWLVYGVLSGDVPVLAANAVTIVLVGTTPRPQDPAPSGDGAPAIDRHGLAALARSTGEAVSGPGEMSFEPSGRLPRVRRHRRR